MSDKKYLLTAISTVAAASFSLSALASDNAADPFQAEDLPAGFMVSADDHEKDKDKDKDKDEEGSCGEGSCGEGSCGEDDSDKDEEGSCGEGSCGEGSCGAA
jgi:uncharacterized low-complexity protein